LAWIAFVWNVRSKTLSDTSLGILLWRKADGTAKKIKCGILKLKRS
jgi:hypothetical protein